MGRSQRSARDNCHDSDLRDSVECGKLVMCDRVWNVKGEMVFWLSESEGTMCSEL